MPNFHPWSIYIIRKCVFLSGLLLAAGLLLWVRADANPELFPRIRHFIQYSQTASAMVLCAGLLGGLLLEDGLRKGGFKG